MIVHPQITGNLRILLETLLQQGHEVHITGISALDLLESRPTGCALEVSSTASIIELAKLAQHLQFPGSEHIDAVFSVDAVTCIYTEADQASYSENPYRITYDLGNGVFRDPADRYYAFKHREPPGIESGQSSWHHAVSSALLDARFGIQADGEIRDHAPAVQDHPLLQRILLLRILESPKPAAGLSSLLRSGYVQSHWPLLHSMVGVSQDKDFHPEGDVWNHTLEMFSYLKSDETDLKLALLLHDCGKAYASEQNNNRFDRHAQIGAKKAAGFLEDLGLDSRLINRVDYLIRHHMTVSHVPKLPYYRIEHIIKSDLYPLLLELLRCDISSSFHDMDIYYEACEHYKQYRKHVRNPYRHADGTRKKQTAGRF
jgi:poly(A) polymerase